MKQLLIIALLLTSFNASAALNKWVDAEGKVHYSDTAPTDVTAQKIRRSSAPETTSSNGEVAAPKSLAEREADWQKSKKSKEEAAQKAEKEQENASIKKKNCEGARSNLSNYENSPRIVTYDEKGERTYLDDAARQQTIEEARKSVSSHCE
jgi:Domain of unknown function (DUF4124)